MMAIGAELRDSQPRQIGIVKTIAGHLHPYLGLHTSVSFDVFFLDHEFLDSTPISQVISCESFDRSPSFR